MIFGDNVMLLASRTGRIDFYSSLDLNLKHFSQLKGKLKVNIIVESMVADVIDSFIFLEKPGLILQSAPRIL